ncbi:lantibiotic dehydratase [Asanoa siamensis]|uniref:Lantibiotic dehydratase n=2 Tax=Asanoa siamensis TaxID=926357 RepID=A0ABQ4CQL7_9ACTN|nr:lantibiotic dehydratase [Asanoa siamensis]
MEREPAVRRHLRVVTNDLCFIRADRVVLPYLSGTSSDEPAHTYRELSIRLIPPVRLVLDLAATPLAYRDLVRKLGEEFPNATEQAIEAMTGQLVEREILLTDLRPPLTTTDPLGYLIDRLRGTDLPQLEIMRQTADRLAHYAAQPLGEGSAAWHAAVDAMRAVHPSDKPPIQVDLRFDADVTLPQAVAVETARAAEVLWRLSSTQPAPPHLRQYHAAFIERYGTDRLVPVLELLDPERGLGVPSGYNAPPGDRRSDPDERAERRPWEDGLAALAERALLDGANEVVLDDELVDMLTAGAPSLPPSPDTMELAVQVLAQSQAALDRDDFRLVVAPSASSTFAGSVFGRFAYLFADAGYAIGPAVASPDRDALTAQLLFSPRHPRSANVLRVPRVCDHILAVGTFAERADPSVLGITDLAVGADAHRLILVSRRDGREVVPVSPHMLNVDSSTGNAVRLIREIGMSRYRNNFTWSWGDIRALPRLPRVRYRSTILEPATWRVGGALRDREKPWPEWRTELAAWRDRWQVPDRVHATVMDNRLELNLTVPLHQQLLREELGRRPETFVQEAIATYADNGWLNGYANEVVVPLTRIDGRVASAKVRRRPCASRRPHLPGGEWLYAKLYSSSARHDELLADYVSLLAGQRPSAVDRWHFVRYADPDPHLRLRFHGPSTVLHEQLLPRLHDWAATLCDAGLASRMILDAYDPEVERYGGPAAIAAAERAFAADSEAVLTQLRLDDDDWPTDLLAAANYVDLLSSFGRADWCDWLLGDPRDEHHQAFQKVRRQALRLIDPFDNWQHLSSSDKGKQVLDAWRRRRPAIAEYGAAVRHLDIADSIMASLLHMHHNRLAGADRSAEARSMAIARGAVRAHLDRAKARS